MAAPAPPTPQPAERAHTLFLDAVRDDPDLGTPVADALRDAIEADELDADQLIELLQVTP